MKMEDIESVVKSHQDIRAQFLQCVQLPNESFDEFLTKLHVLAKKGKFAENTELMILQKIKLDVANKALKQKLEPITDYDKAVAMCRDTDRLQRVSKDPEIIRLRAELKNIGVRKIQDQNDFAHFLKFLSKIRTDKWTGHPEILKCIDDMIQDVDGKMNAGIADELSIKSISNLVLTCSQCDVRIEKFSEIADSSVVIPEDDITFAQRKFKETLNQLPKMFSLLNFLKLKLYGALIQLSMSSQKHKDHTAEVNFEINEKFYCGICKGFEYSFSHFKVHYQLNKEKDESSGIRKNVDKSKDSNNRMDWRSDAKPPGELEAVLYKRAPRNKARPVYKRTRQGQGRVEKFQIDHSDLLAEPDVTVSIQQNRYLKVNAEEYDMVREDLTKTFSAFPNAVFEFYGSRAYGLGFKIDIMIKPFGKDSIDFTANSAEALRIALTKNPEFWKIQKIGKVIIFLHKPTRNSCKIFCGKPDDIFIHNTKMIDYMLNLQPEMRKLTVFLCKWFKRANILYFLRTYSIVLMIITYAQKYKFMPNMVELKTKCLEMKIDKESYESDIEWLNDFKYDLTMKDLGLEEIKDYKNHVKDFFQFYTDNAIKDFVFFPYFGEVVKKSELTNYKVDGKAIFTGYELTGLFIGGLLDFTNNTTHDLWLREYEMIERMIEWSLKKSESLNFSEKLDVQKTCEMLETMKVEQAAPEVMQTEQPIEGPKVKCLKFENRGEENPLKIDKKEEEYDSSSSRSSFDSVYDSTEECTIKSAEVTDLNKKFEKAFDAILMDIQNEMVDPTLIDDTPDLPME